jgi:hypothetical protein
MLFSWRFQFVAVLPAPKQHHGVAGVQKQFSGAVLCKPKQHHGVAGVQKQFSGAVLCKPKQHHGVAGVQKQFSGAVLCKPKQHHGVMEVQGQLLVLSEAERPWSAESRRRAVGTASACTIGAFAPAVAISWPVVSISMHMAAILRAAAMLVYT